MRFWSSFVVVVCLLAASAGSAMSQQVDPQPAQPKGSSPILSAIKPVPVDPADDELQRLLKLRFNEALHEAKAYEGMLKIGVGRLDTLLEIGMEATQKMADAVLELKIAPTEKIAVLEKYLDVCKEYEKVMKSAIERGMASPGEVSRARYYKYDAEIKLLKLKQDLKKASGRKLPDRLSAPQVNGGW